MRLLGQNLPVKEMRLRMAKLLQEERHPLAPLFEETIELSTVPWRIELKRVGGRPAKDVPQGELLALYAAIEQAKRGTVKGLKDAFGKSTASPLGCLMQSSRISARQSPGSKSAKTSRGICNI